MSYLNYISISVVFQKNFKKWCCWFISNLRNDILHLIGNIPWREEHLPSNPVFRLSYKWLKLQEPLPKPRIFRRWYLSRNGWREFIGGGIIQSNVETNSLWQGLMHCRHAIDTLAELWQWYVGRFLGFLFMLLLLYVYVWSLRGHVLLCLFCFFVEVGLLGATRKRKEEIYGRDLNLIGLIGIYVYQWNVDVCVCSTEWGYDATETNEKTLGGWLRQRNVWKGTLWDKKWKCYNNNNFILMRSLF